MSKQIGLFGWIGQCRDKAPAAVFEAMAKAADPSFVAARCGKVDARGALGVFGANSSHFADDGIRVACVGQPRLVSSPDMVGGEQASAAAAIAMLYRRHGLRVLDRIRGAFALAIVEPDSKTVLLALDRMGMETLCYAEAGGGLIFGTRADALTRHPAAAPEADPQAVFNYLFFHMVPAPGTIYRNVAKLLPAQYALWRGGQLKTGFYWEMPYEDRPRADQARLAAEFRRLVPQVVTRAASRGNRVGTFLSGGTDSTTVTGTLAETTPQAIDAYSIGFDAEGFDEMEYARIAADRFRIHHHTYYVTPEDVAQAVPMVAAAYDGPFGNASAVPTYYCAKLARADGIELMLAGDGGDEIFGGNARYAKQKVFEAYKLIPRSLRASLIEPLALRVSGLDRLLPVRKLQSYVQQASIPLPDRLESYNFLVRADLSQIFEPGFLEVIDPAHPFALMREVYDRTRSGFAVNRMMHLDLKQTLADNDLRKVTAMCRAADVDVAYPFLDEEMVDFSARIPPKGKVKGLRLRHFFKEALKDFLPPQIIAKSKHGFGLPFGVWLGEHAGLKELAEDSLQRFARRGYLRRNYIDSLLERHRQEHASYYGVMVWVIMMLELWYTSSPLSRQSR